ncbi:MULTISPECIES: hypothetical protein [Prochlorococcus]|uniref:hypothetical protein n=1 Tax=Prochlorococcus TaxID=1218 RepID=UPI0007B327B7|nr:MULTISPECIES: hypothetical protein [Prochlorococcus]KZR66448.1 hypothetical protein PMIT1312_00913 [Prochlorococcus marinus str. MIT 1312]KZR83388.1 hypothetical protein PMIT1327_00470 [Prochlorococcus marinus str. MIT 1327]NMO83157.1 hypothetical protein [Prochlorococcus sp. P1344]NMP06159.1 hypothetical protein [Prochlorococcus sp. P1361]NMP12302.1 hypothetical protein [Prochlorococcus sp.P1363]
MTDPKENEQVDEELSSEELKSVSGGLVGNPYISPIDSVKEDSPHGSGSGETLKDWKKRNQYGLDQYIGAFN